MYLALTKLKSTSTDMIIVATPLVTEHSFNWARNQIPLGSKFYASMMLMQPWLLLPPFISDSSNLKKDHIETTEFEEYQTISYELRQPVSL